MSKIICALLSIGVAVMVDMSSACAQSQAPHRADPSTPSSGGDEPVATPQNLHDCYMRVAMTKANPDAMYLAREICNALFKKLDPSSLAIYEPKTQKCTEWFFDGDGRYETADLYCAFEPRGDTKYAFACEAKDASKKKFTYADLTRNERRYEKTRTAGYEVGAMFTTMAACVEYKSLQPGVKSD